MMPGQVKAAQNSCEVTIPVQIEVSGDKIPDGETYQITMEAVTKDAPMPAQNVQDPEKCRKYFLWTDDVYSARRLSV